MYNILSIYSKIYIKKNNIEIDFSNVRRKIIFSKENRRKILSKKFNKNKKRQIYVLVYLFIRHKISYKIIGSFSLKERFLIYFLMEVKGMRFKYIEKMILFFGYKKLIYIIYKQDIKKLQKSISKIMAENIIFYLKRKVVFSFILEEKYKSKNIKKIEFLYFLKGFTKAKMSKIFEFLYLKYPKYNLYQLIIKAIYFKLI